MGPLAAALIPAAGSVVGGLVSAFGQGETNRTNLQIAREQMAFQERMSGSSYQRAMKDMSAAGLNPMLAYMQGGASSPQGAMATMSNPGAAMGNAIEDGVSSAMSGLRLQKELRLLDEQKRATKNQADKTFAESQLIQAEMQMPSMAEDREGHVLPRTYWGMYRQLMMDNLRANAASAAAGARIAERDASQETSRFGRGLNWMRRWRESMFGGGNAASAAGQAAGAVRALSVP